MELRGSQTQIMKSSGAQKRAEMLRHPCILGDPQTKGDKIRIGCLTPAVSGAQKRAEVLCHPCIFANYQAPHLGIPKGRLVLWFSKLEHQEGRGGAPRFFFRCAP